MASALTVSGEEKQVGYYFGNKMYARTFVYYSVYSQVNTATLLDSNFPISLDKIDRLEVVRVGWGTVALSGCQAYLVNNSLYLLQGVTSSTLSYVIVTAYYQK